MAAGSGMVRLILNRTKLGPIAPDANARSILGLVVPKAKVPTDLRRPLLVRAPLPGLHPLLLPPLPLRSLLEQKVTSTWEEKSNHFDSPSQKRKGSRNMTPNTMVNLSALPIRLITTVRPTSVLRHTFSNNISLGMSPRSCISFQKGTQEI